MATKTVNGIQKIVIDTGSSIIKIPSTGRLQQKSTTIQKRTNRYQDVNKDKVTFREHTEQ